jgi:hypothetical protein
MPSTGMRFTSFLRVTGGQSENNKKKGQVLPRITSLLLINNLSMAIWTQNYRDRKANKSGDEQVIRLQVKRRLRAQ